MNKIDLKNKKLSEHLKIYPIEILEHYLSYLDSTLTDDDLINMTVDDLVSLIKWTHTKESYIFWGDIIYNKNFKVFFEKYPATYFWCYSSEDEKVVEILKNEFKLRNCTNISMFTFKTEDAIYYIDLDNKINTCYKDSVIGKILKYFKQPFEVKNPISIGDKVMCSLDGDVWGLRTYAGNNECYNSLDGKPISWKYIIPIEEFDPLKHCKY